ncbi:MAG: hypothetical protein ACFCBW_15475 [Candidatus Competibacterales bacterium]
MLSYEDCLGWSDLEEDDVETIADQEHLPTIVALEYACYLLDVPGGLPLMRQRLTMGLVDAERRRDRLQVRRLQEVMAHLDAAKFKAESQSSPQTGLGTLPR